ncbi:MAG TPA: AAA family ATPase, partial [Bryobacteraceae bacterium]|nr:AAA family ATPase [Bryobacteraceae bacterium]
MILHEITVENFRGYRAPVTVKLDGGSPAVVRGRNGSGKSTLLEAAVRVLADRHDVGGKEAARIRPRGTTLAPRIALVFEHGGEVYRITKQFLDSPSARLEKCSGNKFELLDEGKAADQRLREILRSDAAGRGLAGTEETGILQALCCPQGGLALPGLTGKVLEDIRAMLGAQLAGPRGAAFETEVAKKYSKAWSGKGPRKSEAIHGLRAELAKASEEAERCRAGLAQVERYEKTAAKERSRHAGLLAELRNVDIDLIKADEDAGRVTALHAKRQLADSRRKLADAEYRRIADVIRRIGIANESKRKLAEIRPELTAAVDAARAGLEAAKENAAAALVRLNAAA